MNRNEAADHPAVAKPIDHLWQIHIAQSIAVIGQENILMLDEVLDREEAPSDVPLDSGIDQSDAPVRRLLALNLDLAAELGDGHAISRNSLPVVQEIVLDHAGLVTKAENEIAMAVVAVVLHDVPQDRLCTDRHHRLGDAFRVLADPRSKAAAKENNLHAATLWQMRTMKCALKRASQVDGCQLRCCRRA